MSELQYIKKASQDAFENDTNAVISKLETKRNHLWAALNQVDEQITLLKTAIKSAKGTGTVISTGKAGRPIGSKNKPKAKKKTLGVSQMSQERHEDFHRWITDRDERITTASAADTFGSWSKSYVLLAINQFHREGLLKKVGRGKQNQNIYQSTVDSRRATPLDWTPPQPQRAFVGGEAR